MWTQLDLVRQYTKRKYIPGSPAPFFLFTVSLDLVNLMTQQINSATVCPVVINHWSWCFCLWFISFINRYIKVITTINNNVGEPRTTFIYTAYMLNATFCLLTCMLLKVLCKVFFMNKSIISTSFLHLT